MGLLTVRALSVSGRASLMGSLPLRNEQWNQPACGTPGEPIPSPPRCPDSVSRHLKCYRAGIVAPWAMLLSPVYGESHRECAEQARVRAGDLSAVSARGAAGEATHPG